MTVSECISDEALKLLMVGKLSDAEAAPLDEHLLSCPSCVVRTRSLATADTLVSALQGAGVSEPSPDHSTTISKLVVHLRDRSQFGTLSSMFDATRTSESSAENDVAALVAMLEPPAGPDELGRLGAFRILRLLGKGGMGAVFLAEDVQLRRHVALKVLKPELAGQREGIDRFLREARAAAAVRHDHVVTIYQVGESNGIPFLAQELLEGETLDDRLKREGRLPIRDALRIGHEISAGLAAAHRHGLLHRDIKPSNIWLEGSNARVKILDFGLARHEHGDDQLTQSGAIVGTPAYMSPEQAQGLPLDVRSDLFSLGSVLYRMVTGRQPFQGHDTLSCLRSLAVDDPPAPKSLNAEVPAELSDLIVELLQKDRTHRPATAELVSQRLAAISQIPLPLPPPAISAAQPPRNRIDTRWLASGAGAVVILGVIIITITRRDGSKTTINLPDDAAKIEIHQETVAPSVSRSPSTTNQAPAAVAAPKTNSDSSRTPPSTGIRPITSSWKGWPTGTPAPAIAPFNADQAKKHQEDWARHLGVPIDYTNSIGMKFRLIPPGEFVMGALEDEIASENARLDEVYKQDPQKRKFEGMARSIAKCSGPRHRVILTKPFYLGIHEVTRGQFLQLHYLLASSSNLQVTDQHPVQRVAWFEAAEFCAKLAVREQLSPSYAGTRKEVTEMDGNGYRMPTEAEWEYACRAGTDTPFWSGNSEADLRRVGWWKQSTVDPELTHPVGALPANPFGLHDMHGNVDEWCQDRFSYYTYEPYRNLIAVDPLSVIQSDRRTVRGGACNSAWALACSSGRRVPQDQIIQPRCTGFRVLLPLEAVRKLIGK